MPNATATESPNYERLARMMGAAWQRGGFDVLEKLRLSAPYWPGSKAYRLRLASLCLAAASEAAE